MRPSRLSILTVIAAALPLTARAAELQVTSSTQVLGYSDLLSTQLDQGTLAEYLRVNVTSLDAKGRYNIYGYGRITGQLTTLYDAKPELINDSSVYGRLYYLFLDARDVVPNHLDFRLGRTYVAQGALPSNLDGAFVRARNLGVDGVGVTAFGGHRVYFDNVTEQDHPDDLTAGGTVYVDTVRRTHIEAGYARKWLQGDYAQDFAAIDLNSAPFDRLNLTGRAKYDVGDTRWAELLGSVNVYPFDPLDVPLVVRGEFQVERPSFDQYSFYSFFDVARYQELGAAVEYEVLPGVRLNARYAYENFAATKDNVDQHANVLEGGVMLRVVRNLVVNASYLNRNGFASRLSGLRVNAAYVMGKLGLLGGVDYDDFRRDLARTDTSKRVWVGANYDFTKQFKLSIHAEDDVTYLSNNRFQGIAALIFTL